MKYKHAIQLHKVYNNELMSKNLIFNSHFNALENVVHSFKNFNYKVGSNVESTGFVILNGKIYYNWLNETLEAFKTKFKMKLLA